MTDFIPGDSYRIDVVGADSTTIIDSWLSQIKADVVSRDGVVQVDTTFGKLYGPMVGNVESLEGDMLINASAGKAFLNVQGNILDSLNNTVLDTAQKLLTATVKGDIVDAAGVVVYDHNTNTFSTDRIVGNFYGTLYGAVELVGVLKGDVEGNLAGTTTGTHIGPQQGNVTGNLTGDIYNLEGDIILHASSGKLTGDLQGNLLSPTGDRVLQWDKLKGHYNLQGGIEHPSTNETILSLTSDDQGAHFKGSIKWHDGTDIVKLIPWIGTDKPEYKAEFTGRLLGEVTDADQNPMLRYLDGTQLLGTNNDEINIGRTGTETVRVFSDNVEWHLQSNPINTVNLGQINSFAFNGDDDNKLPLNPGDHMMVFTAAAFDGEEYKVGGGFGMFANITKIPDPELEIYPTDFAITLSDGENLPSAFWDNPTGLNFDGEGVLAVPIFKSKGRTSAEFNDVNAEEGMIIFNKTTKKFQGYNGTAWVDLG